MPVDGAHVVFHRKLATLCGEVEGVLLCKRTQDAPSDAGRWSFPGGMLKPHESARAGAIREVLEEFQAPRTPIETALKKMVHLCDVSGAGTKGVRFFKSLLAVGMDKLRLGRTKKTDKTWNKVEAEGWAWFTMAEARCLDMRGQDRCALIAYFKDVP